VIPVTVFDVGSSGQSEKLNSLLGKFFCTWLFPVCGDGGFWAI
jgi:hypothetical protein